MSTTPKLFQIRADYDRETIVVYQAYRKEIAIPAIKTGGFQPPFSFNRMTWIKPSFLWLMARSNWGQKSGQEYILAIRIKRKSWESALAEAVLTNPEKRVYNSPEQWRGLFEKARVQVQWDPERSLRGAKLNYWSIQVGISRQLIEEYVNEWIVAIADLTPLVKKIQSLRKAGNYSNAKRLLPQERVYPLSEEIEKRLGMD